MMKKTHKCSFEGEGRDRMSARAPALWHRRDLRRPHWRRRFRLGGIRVRDERDFTRWRRVVEEEEHEDVGDHHQKKHHRNCAATSHMNSSTVKACLKDLRVLLSEESMCDFTSLYLPQIGEHTHIEVR